SRASATSSAVWGGVFRVLSSTFCAALNRSSSKCSTAPLSSIFHLRRIARFERLLGGRNDRPIIDPRRLQPGKGCAFSFPVQTDHRLHEPAVGDLCRSFSVRPRRQGHLVGCLDLILRRSRRI